MATEMTDAPSHMSTNEAGIVDALKLAAEGREEYANGGAPDDWREYLKGQAAGFRRAAQLIEKGDVLQLIADNVPSWRWPEVVHEAVTQGVI